MSVIRRTLVLAVAGTALVTLPAPAVATSVPGNLGPVIVTPASGDDSTLFSGSVDAQCPASTIEAQLAVVGPGSDYLTNGEGALTPGAGSSPTGDGLVWFVYGSVANLRTATSTMFTADATYAITLYCQAEAPDGSLEVTEAYVTEMRYTAGSPGTWEIVTPGAAVAGEEFFNPQILQLMNQDLSGLPEASLAPPSAEGSPEQPTAEASADVPAEAPADAAPADPDAGQAPADEGQPAVPDASQQDAAALQNSTEGSAADSNVRLWALSGIAIAVVLLGVFVLVINNQRRNARIDSLGSVRDEEEGVLVGHEIPGTEGDKNPDRTSA